MPEDTSSGMSLELYYSKETVTGYLSSFARHFERDVKVQVLIGSDAMETVILDIHEGQMRARLPEELTLRLIRSLQDGQEVSILVGTQTQIFRPERFNALYHQLTQKGFFQGLFP